MLRLRAKSYRLGKQGDSVIDDQVTDDPLMTETIATYDRIAATYAARTWDADLEAHRQAFAKAIVGAAPASRFRILDAGCGPGRDARWFQERGFQVTAVDRSPGMLDEARRRAPGVDFRQADLRQLEFSPDYFDGVWASASLLHLLRGDVAAVLDSFNHLLGHGYLFLSIQSGQGEEVRARGYGADNPRRFTYFSRTEIELLVERAGFDVHAVQDDQLADGNRRSWISILAQTKLRTPLLGAVAVIFDEHGRVLLSERADGRGWNLPAGFVDAEESPEEGAVRETREETGLEVVTERLIGLYTTNRRPRAVGPTVRGTLVTHAFLCRQVGGELRLTNEALQHGWFSPDALPSPLASQRHADIVRDTLATLAGTTAEPVVRRYQ